MKKRITLLARIPTMIDTHPPFWGGVFNGRAWKKNWSCRLFVMVASALLAYESNAFLDYSGGTLREDFNLLGTNSVSWTNNSTFPGWYAYSSLFGWPHLNEAADDNWSLLQQYRRAYGQDIRYEYGYLLNLGTSDSDSNRSLGSYSFGIDIAFALVLRNNTNVVFHGFALTFYGEQWQANTVSSNRSMKLDFSYGVFPAFSTYPYNPNTVVPNMPVAGSSDDFYKGYLKPTNNSGNFFAFHFPGTGSTLDGHDAANRKKLNVIVSDQCWGPGEFLVLRWFDDYTTWAVQQMLAIDDLEFTAFALPPDTSCLDGAAFSAAEGFRFNLVGEPGQMYSVETSTNMSNWIEITNALLPAARIRVLDSGSLNDDRRFYRGRRP